MTGIAVEVDTNADGTPDQTTTTDALGNYSLDLAVATGSVSVQVRTREIEAGTGQLLYSGWQAFAFTYEEPTNAAAGLSSFTLKTDTGASSTDGITTDATLKGTATNDGTVSGLTVVFDHDADNVADGTATTDSSGNFEYVPAGLTFGAASIRARVKEFDAEGVAQYGSWQTLTFIYEDAALVELRIDELALTNDTGNSNTDGATADAAISGHIANTGGQAVTLEIDKDGNGTVDATVTSNAADGNFSYSPTGLANGLVTIRARVQAAADQPVKPWTTLSFVLHTDPDGTEAQQLVSAFSGFNTLWQNARTNYTTAITTADQLFRSQTQTAQEAYDGSLATASALRKSQIESAQSAYRAILAGAEQTRASALAAAATQFATDLANFAGDTTSYVLKQFVWPEAPPDFAHQIPDDKDQPRPPMAGPVYEGSPYSFGADEQYLGAAATADYQYHQAVRAAEATYRVREAEIEAAYREDEAEAYEIYWDQLVVFYAQRDVDLATGINPTDLVTVTNTIRTQQQALTDKYNRDVGRAQKDYDEGAAEAWADYWEASANASVVETANLAYARDAAIAGFAYIRTTAQVALLESYELAHGALTRQLAEAAATHAHWEKEREIDADLAYEQKVADQQKILDIALAAARQTKVKDLATAARNQEVSIQTAEVTRWQAKAEAQVPAVEAWDTFENTPWSQYQQEQTQHSVAYVTGMAPQIVAQIEGDANAALTEAHAVADQRFELVAGVGGSAELKRVRRRADNESWRDFRLAANDEVENEAFSAALRWQEHEGAFRAAEGDFGQAQADAQHPYDVEAADIRRDETIWSDGNPCYDDWEVCQHWGDEFWIRDALNTHAFTLAVIAAKETRDLAFSAAAMTFAEDSAFDELDREVALTGAYQTYQVAAALHAKNYAVGYADKYAAYVTAVSAADKTASQAFAASEKTLSDQDAGLQNAWNTSDTTSLKDFYAGAANVYAGVLNAWNTAAQSPWTKFLAGLAGVEVDRVGLLGQKLVDHATAAGTELVGWLTGLSGNAKTLADGTAAGLDEQTQGLANGLKTYALAVAEARRAYAEDLATKTALHDKGVTAANQAYKNAQAERERVRENAKDAAQWAYERRVADAWRDERAIDDNHESFWPRVESESAAAGHVQTLADAQTEHDYAIGLATDQRDWVAAVGLIHVQLAADAKAAADTLAASLKTASDGLTGDQAEAAKGLASDLATAEADYTSSNAALQASHDNAAAVPDGQLEIDLTAVANLQREGLTRERNEYESDSYGRHNTAISALGSTSLVAPGGPSGPLGDLVGYQRGVAAQDLAWSTGKGTAQNNFESLLSSAYLTHATAEHGPLGSVPTRIQATGAANVSRITGLANSDKTLSIDSTGNLADFTEAAQSAASKAAKDGVAAETEYDVGRATAKAAYHNALAAAELARTIATQDAQLAFTLATPYPQPEGWLNSTEYQNLLQILSTALTSATTTYEAAVKQAKIDHATAVGDKQILRAGKLGDAKVTEATEKKQGEDTYWAGQKLDENTFEASVTTTSLPGIQGEAAAERDYNIVAGGNQRTAMAAIQAAYVQLVQDLAPVNVAHAAGIIAAEGDFHAATSSRTALVWTNYASGFPTISRESFHAAQANAESQWISGMRPAVVAYVTATTQAEADEAIALMQATAAAENSRALADEAYAAAVEPLVYQQTAASGAAWRDHAANERDRVGTLNVTNAGHRGTQGISYATAVKTRGIAYATADKTYQVALLERGPLVVVPPDPPPAIDPLELDQRVAHANADLAEMEDRGDADVLYIAGIVAGDDVYRDGRSAGYTALETALATIDRDLIVARSGHDQAHAAAWLAAQTTQWNAEIAAAGARRSAVANALADLRAADYAQNASAIASIDAAMDLPWTQHIADKAAALSGWWTSTEEADFLALAAALNSAETTYQTAVNTAYSSWITVTAGAEAAFLQAGAEQERTERINNVLAEQVYEQALADADGVWQNGRILNLQNHRNEFWTDRRDAIAENDTTWARVWETEAMLGHPGDAEADRAFVISESTISGTRIVSRTTNRRDRIVGEDASYLPYIQTTADADRDYAQAESAAATARMIAILNATADHDIASAQSLSGAIDALALASQTPWAAYDAAIAELNENYVESVAPAARDLNTALANADKAYTDSRADGVYTLSVALSQHGATYRASMASAKLANAQGTAQARTAAAQFMPIAELNALAPTGAAPTTTGTTGTPGTELPSDPDAPCGCPLAPRQPNGLPKLQPATPADVENFAIAQASSTGFAPESGIDIGLPADPRHVNDETAASDGPFTREALNRPRRDDREPPQVIDSTAPKGWPFTVHITPAELALSPFTQGAPIIAGNMAPSPLPEGFEVNVDWTDKEVEAAAIGIVLGSHGQVGALTVQQQQEVQRWISVIKAHMALQYSLKMNKGPERNALIRELERIMLDSGKDEFDPAVRNLYFASYQELKDMLARHLGAGADVDQWIRDRLHQERLEAIERRLSQYQLEAEQNKLFLDLVQLGLDIGGIFEPTPFCDAASGFISVTRGQIFDAAINVVAILPYAGDVTKLAKFGKYLDALANAGRVAARNPQFARLIEPILAEIVRILDSVPIDKISKEVAEQFRKLREEAYNALAEVRKALAKWFGTGPAYKTWNEFQAGTKGQFASRAEAAKAWEAYKQAHGIVTGVTRSSAAKKRFLKALADDPNTPGWMKQWLRRGEVPPGYDVDHINPLSVGGLDDPSNMRLQLRELHKIHHRYYRPWE